MAGPIVNKPTVQAPVTTGPTNKPGVAKAKMESDGLSKATSLAVGPTKDKFRLDAGTSLPAPDDTGSAEEASAAAGVVAGLLEKDDGKFVFSLTTSSLTDQAFRGTSESEVDGNEALLAIGVAGEGSFSERDVARRLIDEKQQAAARLQAAMANGDSSEHTELAANAQATLQSHTTTEQTAAAAAVFKLDGDLDPNSLFITQLASVSAQLNGGMGPFLRGMSKLSELIDSARTVNVNSKNAPTFNLAASTMLGRGAPPSSTPGGKIGGGGIAE